MNAHTERRAAGGARRTHRRRIAGGDIIPTALQKLWRNKIVFRDEKYAKLKRAIAARVGENKRLADAFDKINISTTSTSGQKGSALNAKTAGDAALNKLQMQIQSEYPQDERDLRDEREIILGDHLIDLNALVSLSGYKEYRNVAVAENAKTSAEHGYSEVNNKTVDATYTQEIKDAELAQKDTAVKFASTELLEATNALNVKDTEINNDTSNALIDVKTSIDDKLKNINGARKAQKKSDLVFKPDFSDLQSQHDQAKKTFDDLTARISGISAPSSGSSWMPPSGAPSSVPLAYAAPVPGASVPFSPTDSFIQVPAAVVAADVDSISVRLRRSTTAGYTDNFYPENIEFFNKSGKSERKVDKFGALEGSLFDVEPVVGKAVPTVPSTGGPTVPSTGGPTVPSTVQSTGGPTVPSTVPPTGGPTPTVAPFPLLKLDDILREINMMLDDVASGGVNAYCEELRDSLIAETTTNIANNNHSDSKENKDIIDDNIANLNNAIDIILSIRTQFKAIYDECKDSASTRTDDKKTHILTRMLQFLYFIMYYLSIKFPSYISTMQSLTKDALLYPFNSSLTGHLVHIGENQYDVNKIISDMKVIFSNSHAPGARSYPFIESMKRLGLSPSVLEERGTFAVPGASTSGIIGLFQNGLASTKNAVQNAVGVRNTSMVYCIAYYLSEAFRTKKKSSVVTTPPTSELSPDCIEFINMLIEDGKFYTDIGNLTGKIVANITFLDAAATPTTVSGGRKTRSRAAARRARRTHAQRLL